MKQIYVGHAMQLDYQNLLYAPLRQSPLWQQYHFILPHDKKEAPELSKNIITQSDLMIAEVSYPSTGLGIELAWAEMQSCPILCIYQESAKISNSLALICKDFIRYQNSKDMIQQLEIWLSRFPPPRE